MTGKDILARVAFLAKVTLSGGDAEYIALINEGLNDLSLEAPYETYSQLEVSAETREVSLPTGFLSLLDIRIATTVLDPTTPNKEDTTQTGTPARYAIVGEQIWLYPEPDDDFDLDLEFMKGYGSITALTSTAGTPSLLPSIFHPALAYWVAFHMTPDSKLAALLLQEYKRLRESLQIYQMSRGDYPVTREA